MINSTIPSRFLLKVALATVGYALAVTLAPAPAARAASPIALNSLDDKAPSLPLTASFAKSDGEDGPYILSLKNTSDASVKVSAKVLLSVYFHADSKAKNIPEHSVDAGQVWTIPGLAAGDKVIVSSEGFAPLEVTVP